MANDMVKANTENIDFNVPNGFINTINLETNSGKMKVVNAINNTVPLKDFMDVELHVVDCITMPGVRKGRNNMPDTNCVNTYLIDVEGNSYFSQSDGVARAVKMFAALWDDFGKSTEEGYLKVKCISQDLPNGNTLKTMVFVD